MACLRRTAVENKTEAGMKIAELGDLVSGSIASSSSSATRYFKLKTSAPQTGGKFLDEDTATEVFLEALEREEAAGAREDGEERDEEAPGESEGGRGRKGKERGQRTRWFVLDGFPRNCEQLRRLEGVVSIELAIHLQ
eukprot:667255-Rhodomonas_salina.1